MEIYNNTSYTSLLMLLMMSSSFAFIVQGQVVQSIVSLPGSVRGQLVKCYTTL